MAVGDIESNGRGTGARFNDGKPPLDLIPVRHWLALWRDCVGDDVAGVLRALMQFQEGNHKALRSWIRGEVDSCWMDDAVAVFGYGAQKYKAWNWAKGMEWTVPTGCILRHTQQIYEGETTDAESGLPHTGHITCNIIMLDWFVDHYPEGNNFPPVYSR